MEEGLWEGQSPVHSRTHWVPRPPGRFCLGKCRGGGEGSHEELKPLSMGGPGACSGDRAGQDEGPGTAPLQNLSQEKRRRRRGEGAGMTPVAPLNCHRSVKEPGQARPTSRSRADLAGSR